MGEILRRMVWALKKVVGQVLRAQVAPRHPHYVLRTPMPHDVGAAAVEGLAVRGAFGEEI